MKGEVRVIRATLAIDPAFRVGPVRRRTFGSFVLSWLFWLVPDDCVEDGLPVGVDGGWDGLGRAVDRDRC
jgi:hypothetical protein